MDQLRTPPRTPGRRGTGTLIASTPCHRLHIHEPGTTTNLNGGRKANSDDLGPEIRRTSKATFFESYLPPEKPLLGVEKLVHHLISMGHLTADGNWTEFDQEPKKSKNENKCYSKVEDICDAIAMAAYLAGHEDDPWSFLCTPTSKLSASLCETSAQPDAGLYLGLHDGVPSWDAMAAAGEFKKKEHTTEVNQNTRQLSWGVSQIMRNDPQRRYTFGFSIECTTIRVWYADRSVITVCEDFDLFNDYTDAVSFFSRLLYAEETELGWDPTMVPLLRADGIPSGQYHITVRDQNGEERIYRTLSMLSSVKAQALRGRATRVWRCVEVDEDGQLIGSAPVALKDTWIDEDREREGTIMEQILKTDDEELAKTLRSSFLTVETHGDVYVDGWPDLTRVDVGEDTENPFIVEKPSRNESKRRAEEDQLRAAMGSSYRSPDLVPDKVDPYHLKVHYRAVFKEIGKPLVAETSLLRIFAALGEVVYALGALHRSGWVHRDMSSENILIVNGKAKIADLEYAKRYDSTSPIHRIRSNTYFYSPVEIDHNRLVFAPPVVTSTESVPNNNSFGTPSFDEFMQELHTQQEESRGEMNRDDDTIPWHPIHDIESSWWSGVDSIVNREVMAIDNCRPKVSQTPRARWEQRQYAARLFYTQDARLAALQHPSVFMQNMRWLHPAVAKAGSLLADIRNKLAEAYTELEQDESTMDFFKFPEKLHGDVNTMFFQIARLFVLEDVTVAHHSRS